MFEAKRRSGLCVLDYVVTSNHIHLLVKDTGGDVIAESMQLMRVAPPKSTTSAKESRVRSGKIVTMPPPLRPTNTCIGFLTYIDLNMVRVGAVKHPEQWNESGYSEIQKPPKRYGIIDLQRVSEMSRFAAPRDFQKAHREWVEDGLVNGLAARDDRWSEAIAVGGRRFVENVKIQLGGKAGHPGVVETDSRYVLRESDEIYSSQSDGKMEPLSTENSLHWNENFVAQEDSSVRPGSSPQLSITPAGYKAGGAKQETKSEDQNEFESDRTPKNGTVVL